MPGGGSPLCQGRHLRHHPVLQHGAQGGGGGGGKEQRAACSCLPREAAASVGSPSSSTRGLRSLLRCLSSLPAQGVVPPVSCRRLGAPLPSRCTFLPCCFSFHSVDSDPSKLTQPATRTALRCQASLGIVHRRRVGSAPGRQASSALHTPPVRRWIS